MQRLNRYGLRVINSIAQFSSDTKDEAARLAEAALNTKTAQTGLTQAKDLQKRAVNSLSRAQLIITDEDIARAAVKVANISQRAIIEKRVLEKMKLGTPSIDAKDRAPYVTGGFYSWSTLPHQRVNIQQNGSIVLLNSDKRVLIEQFVTLVDKGVIIPEKQILLLNEGCDNGDFLGLMIPFLSHCGSELKIVLVNGNKKKLEEAAHFSRSLLQDQDVEYLLHDSFRSVPQAIDKYLITKHFIFFFDSLL